MILGIDASNIRAGGGITHLSELLCHADPERHGFDKIVIWASLDTLSKLPDREWINKINHAFLNRSILYRIFWQKYFLSKEAKKHCDLLFLPAGNTSRFHPYISMCQNLLPFEPTEKARYGLSPTRVRLEILKWNQSKSFRKADGVIFLSKYSVDQVFNCCNSIGNYTVISHGVSKSFKSDKKPATKRREAIKILYVSIIDLYKHQWQVVRAVHKLLDLKYNVELTLVGPSYSPARKKLIKAIKERPEYNEKIIIKGKVDHDKLSEIYHDNDLFVFASSCETFGMIVLEAMNSNLPIACSNLSSMNEILDDAGLFFDPMDVNKITNTIKRYLDNPELRKEFAVKAGQRALDFSWEKCADQTFKFLRNTYENSN